MKRAILFCNGEINNLSFVAGQIRDDDIIICCDGGGRYCRELGVVPDICIGDFDSLDKRVLADFTTKGTKCLPYPRDKDYIDLVLGIETAIGEGADSIVVFAAFGGPRYDMCLGNMLAIAKYDVDICLKDEHNCISCIGAKDNLATYTINGKKGDYISLLAVTPSVGFECSRGLKYDLKGITLSCGETRGISNELTDTTASVTIGNGKIWLCHFIK